MSVEYIIENYLFFIFILITVSIIIFKSQHPFLYHYSLPVFKKYNMIYYLKSPHIVQTTFDTNTKIYDSRNTHTIPIKEIKINDVIRLHLEQHCYLMEKSFLSKYQQEFFSYSPTITYLQSLHSTCSYLSFHVKNNKTIGRIWSRELILYLFKKSSKKYESHKIQMNDFLCIDEKERKRDIVPKLIYSHVANICNLNNDNQSNYASENKIFIAKYENTRLPLVPLVSYTSYIYNTIKWKLQIPTEKNIEPVKISRIQSDNIKLFIDFFENVKNMKTLDFILCVPLQMLKNVLDANTMYIYILHHQDEVFAAFMFHDTKFKYNKLNMIECVSSLKGCKCDDKLFYHAFYYVIQKLKTLNFYSLSLECVADNIVLQNMMKINIKSLYSVPMYLHTINYIQTSLNPHKCLCIY